MVGEAIAEELLFARSIWRLSVCPDIPAVVPITSEVRPALDGERHDALALRWQAAWNAIWADYRAAEDSRTPLITSSLSQVGMPETWSAGDRRLEYSASELNLWRLQLPRPTASTSILAPVAQGASEAHSRGLSMIVVLPVTTRWWTVVEERFLLASSQTLHEVDTLRRVLESFSTNRSSDI